MRATGNGAWTPEKVLAAFQLWAQENPGKTPRLLDFKGAGDRRFPSSVTVMKVFGSWNQALEAAGFSGIYKARGKRARS